MEMATMPQQSSAMSTTAGGDFEPVQSTTAPIDAADTSRRSREPQQHESTNQGSSSGINKKSEKKPLPHKSASDSRVSTLQQGAERPDPSAIGTSRDDRDHTDYQILKYGASHVIHLFVPVSLCMAAVIITIKSVGFYSEKSGDYLPYTPFHSDTEDTGILFAQSIGNAFVMLGVVVVMTVILILLYYYRFYKVIHGWLILTTLMLLTFFTITYIHELFKNYNIPLDYVSMSFFVWNCQYFLLPIFSHFTFFTNFLTWCLVGMICIHWNGPLLLQQFYLIVVSALMALTFIKFLPDWTVWTVLGILSIWDLVAVLCPKGPLRILVETAQERNEPIFPALIYSSNIMYPYVIYGAVSATGIEPGEDGNDSTQQEQQQQPVEELASSSSPTDVLLGGDESHSSQPAIIVTTAENAAIVRVVESEAPGTTEATASSTGIDGGGTQRAQPPVARVAPQRRGRSTGTSADSNNTLITTLTTSGGSRTRTTSRTQRADRSADAQRRSQSPRHPASERGVAATDRGDADSSNAAVEERGVKLGLGDFIFYSVLVGKASSYGDWNITIACYVSILVGLAFTLMLLALVRKALPALPISIFAGISFFFATRWVITPFTGEVSARQILL